MDCSGTLSRTLPRNLFEKRFVGTSKNFQKEFGIHSFRSTVCRPFQDSKNCSMRIPPHYSFRKDQSFDSFFLLNYLFVSSFCFIRFSMTIWKILHFRARFHPSTGNNPLLVTSSCDSVSIYASVPRVCCGRCLRQLPLWWAQVDSNHRPRAYQARALTC